jgi:hypothetical protein
MGYRSDVTYIIAFPDDRRMYSFIAQAKVLSNTEILESDVAQTDLAKWGDMEAALNECAVIPRNIVSPDPAMIFFSAEAVKWYPSYPDVMSHDSLLALAEVNLRGYETHRVPLSGSLLNGGYDMTPIAMRFIRVGEDTEDVTIIDKGSCWLENYIDIRRAVNIAGALEHKAKQLMGKDV